MDSVQAPSHLCKFFLYGHCKRKSNCEKSHNVETCAMGRRCRKLLCQRRHPKDCVYGNQCGFKSCNHLRPPSPMETVLLLQKDDDYPSDQNPDLGEELTRAYKRIALLEEEKETLIREMGMELFKAQSNVKSLEEKVDVLEKIVKEKEEVLSETMASASLEKAQLMERIRKYIQSVKRGQNDNAKLQEHLSKTRTHLESLQEIDISNNKNLETTLEQKDLT